ncbi:DUF4332 domain-containing protein [Stieleria varia]|uniref:Pathogenicity locus n=1 Tax=Stieleria varia TaxID=2528005 RepID=A0A5C6BDN2_9BACT|nr:DUF4332 domain-containing protein [Stieleria varia]TWU08544.1 Pathogenicity locus [Stieleria varia]
MLLDRIDIDSHGPLNRVELGPFAEHLNVVTGPEGSGKTAIARFIRDSLIHREYPLGMMSSSTGRVVWADVNGRLHCRREKDGTSTGRRTVEFESRGDSAYGYDGLRGSWLAAASGSTDATRALQSLRVPESLIDGVVVDTAISSVTRVVAACIRSGLDTQEFYRDLPANSSSMHQCRNGQLGSESKESDERRKLRDELARVEAELARSSQHGEHVGPSTTEHERLTARRNELSRRLANHSKSDSPRPVPPTRQHSAEYMQWSHRLEQLHDRIWNLQVEQNELRRWIDYLDADRQRFATSEASLRSRYAADGLPVDSYQAVRALRDDARLRSQLQEIDVQVLRWRRVLAEIRGLQEAALASRQNHPAGWYGLRYPGDPTETRRNRMEQFIRSLDHHGERNQWDDYYRHSGTSGIDEIDARIEAALRQLDGLVRQYAGNRDLDFAATDAPIWNASWYRGVTPVHGRGENATLVDTLRSIRSDLENARQHGFRYDGVDRNATESMLSATAERQRQRRESELYDLGRCERWLVGSIEQLLSHRESLIRQYDFADQLRYPAWGSNTRYTEHGDGQYSDWYLLHLQREGDLRRADHQRVTAELERCLDEAASIRRSMRGLPVVAQWNDVTSHLDSEIWIDREAILTELRDIDRRLAGHSRTRWLRNRRAELIDRLGVPHTRDTYQEISPLATEASQWLVRLSAGRLRQVNWDRNAVQWSRTNEPANGNVSYGRVLIDGRDEATCSGVDRALASLAVRMAAADLLEGAGRSLPLVIETHRELLTQETVASGEFRGDGYLPASLRNHDIDGRGALALVAALQDFVTQGRQVILLTSSEALTHQVIKAGARSFRLQADRIVHPHRPIWRPHYASETYVGPYAHTYGDHVATGPASFVDNYHDHFVDAPPVPSPPVPSPVAPLRRPAFRPAALSPNAPAADINRNFDMAWREAYGLYDNPERPAPPVSQHPEWIDGYYFADAYTTSPRSRDMVMNDSANGVAASGSVFGMRDTVFTTAGESQQISQSIAARGLARPTSPFFLTVDSPIDQAPSVDAVAAARLRGLSVTHVNHLMQQDPNRLADALGLANVDAATVRRWQSECRLVCHVPQLRGFDARVLVGCGITNPAQLASTNPVELLERVESFLATADGQRILLSGTSYELSRITSWIAAANRNALDPDTVRYYDTRTIDGRVLKARGVIGDHDSDRYEYRFDDDGNEIVYPSFEQQRNRARRREILRARRNRSQSNYGIRNVAGDDRDVSGTGGYAAGNGNGFGNGFGRPNRATGNSVSSSGLGNGSRNGSGSGSGNGNGSGSGYGSGAGNGQARSNGSRRSSERGERTPRQYVSLPNDASVESEYRRAERPERESREARQARESRDTREGRRSREDRDRRERSSSDSERELRFYLARNSPIVDAPSIGSRMAARLEAVGIYTVDDLLNADADALAAELDHRRIDASVITAWQQQATLVCRIPMLRGHDAQLLVAAEITTAEEVASQDPQELLSLVTPVARSNEGKRILRGSKSPDLEEVTEWIECASQNRELVAA